MTAVGGSPVVALDRVGKCYGDATILDGIAFTVGSGEIVALLGPNGSGKSTILKIVSMLVNHDTGNVRLFGNGIGGHEIENKKRMGIVFDHNAHFEDLSGYENAWFFARSYGLPEQAARTQLEARLRWAGLWEKRNDAVKTYSFGMKRKLAIVEALMHAPELLVFDEPSIGLDYASRLALYGLLDEEAAKGKSVLFATNDVAEATLLAHRVLLLSKGRVVAEGTPEELVASVKADTKIEVRLAAPVPLGEIEGIDGISGVSVDEECKDCFKIDMLAAAGSDVLSDLVKEFLSIGGTIKGIDIKQPTLGDVFLKYSGVTIDAAV